MELKAGDVVMLKSGGQPLTVVEVKEDDVLCLWMGMEGNLYRETLPLAVLDRAVEEDDEEEDDEDEDEEDDEDTERNQATRPSIRGSGATAA